MSVKYPTEETLKQIEEMDCKDFHAFMDFIHNEWEFADWGWKRDGDVYYISTGGWSGNEDLIQSMRKNFMFWMLFWQQSRRGGHYIFCPITTDV